MNEDKRNLSLTLSKYKEGGALINKEIGGSPGQHQHWAIVVIHLNRYHLKRAMNSIALGHKCFQSKRFLFWWKFWALLLHEAYM